LRWAASPNACAEAPRLLTLTAGRGLGGRGRGWEVAQGVRQALPGWHRRLWSVRRRGARQLRRVRRRAGCCRPHARLPRRSVPHWSVGALERWSVGALERWSVGALERWGVAGLDDALGGPFGGFVSSGFCPGGLFGRDRGLCPRLGARLTCPLRFGLGAPQGFVRRRDGRASADEGTAVADTRSAARRAASALLVRGPVGCHSQALILVGPHDPDSPSGQGGAPRPVTAGS